MSTSLFPPSSPAGHGTVHLTFQPSQFRTLTYAYPLKLISPSPLAYDSRIIHTLFLLTYGGGLVAGDSVTLNVTLDPKTSLILLTQGSTKIFKTPKPKLVSTQHMTVSIGTGAALCYLPDPVQPFSDSAFEQSQIYKMAGPDSSMCVCDWVCCGRAARGEKWDFWKYCSRNEVWDLYNSDRPRLMLRDNLILRRPEGYAMDSIAAKTDNLGVIATLILRGPVFEKLGNYFMSEFEALPRIGAKRWDDEPDEDANHEPAEHNRRLRLQKEAESGLIWTVARVRGFVVVKVGSKEIEGTRRWLRSMLRDESSIESYFGERALLCLK